MMLIHDHVDVVFLKNEAIDVESCFKVFAFLFDDSESLAAKTSIYEISVAV